MLPLRLRQLHHGNDASVKVSLDVALLCFSQQHHCVCWPVIRYKKPCRVGVWGQGGTLRPATVLALALAADWC